MPVSPFQKEQLEKTIAEPWDGRVVMESLRLNAVEPFSLSDFKCHIVPRGLLCRGGLNPPPRFSMALAGFGFPQDAGAVMISVTDRPGFVPLFRDQ